MNRKEKPVRRILTSLFLAATVAVLTTACSQKGPAEEAIKAADASVAAAKATVEKYIPDQWKALNDAVKDAKDKLAKADYPAALAAAQAIPGKATEAVKAANAKKDELTKTWAGMEANLAGAIKAAEEKVASVAAMKKLPKGLDAAKLDAAKAGLADAKKGAEEASAAGKAGDVLAAIEKGKAAQDKAGDVVKALETPAPAPAAAPAKKSAPAKKTKK
ncbi:MAG: hypothetical protein ACHQPI_08175 [Thermoanaerobaculia bacterium]